MDKVKLTQLQADALDYAFNELRWTKENILVKTIRRDWDSENMQVLNEFAQKDANALLIAKAIINGYEVEQTPEHKVREFYQEQCSVVSTAQSPSPYAIKNVLNLLNIKIKGVND